jgi:hypothetical protein
MEGDDVSQEGETSNVKREIVPEGAGFHVSPFTFDGPEVRKVKRQT